MPSKVKTGNMPPEAATCVNKPALGVVVALLAAFWVYKFDPHRILWNSESNNLTFDGAGGANMATNADGDLFRAIQVARSAQRDGRPLAAFNALVSALSNISQTDQTQANNHEHPSVWDAAAYQSVRVARTLPKLDGLELLQLMSDLLSLLRRPENAVFLRKEVLRLRSVSAGTSVADLVMAYAHLAEDLQSARYFEEALETIRQARKVHQLNHASAAVLLRMESEALSCQGDAVAALAVLEQALRLTGPPQATLSHQESTDALHHIDLLRRVLREADPAPPPQVVAAMQKRIDQRVANLMRRGTWTHPQQLPGTHVRGLTARPWHSTADHFLELAPVEALLRSAQAALGTEFTDLKRRGLLLRETECIHDLDRGDWWHYSVNGLWLEQDADGCSTDTPVSCSLLRSIRALGLPSLKVVRAGFSAVQPAAHLLPHSGRTNAQLKFHLGLFVPSGGCARIRVGNETRRWTQGEVLFFDDSWEHEVWNDCREERVVFQLVVAHPELLALSAPNEGGLQALDTMGLDGSGSHTTLSDH